VSGSKNFFVENKKRINKNSLDGEGQPLFSGPHGISHRTKAEALKTPGGH
jgi:hypothetical protein